MIDTELYKEHIADMLDICIQQNKRKFILYPNGEITSIVRQMLVEVYHISPIFIVDNYKYDEKTVFSFEKAEQMTEEDMYYLVCSDNDLYYDDIRNALKMYIGDAQIIDLFPDIDNKEMACKLLKEIDEDIESLEI